MQDEYDRKLAQQKQMSRNSAILIFASMLVMALWGWTPLKGMVPAMPVLIVWLLLSLSAAVLAGYSFVRKQQTRALKSQIEDKQEDEPTYPE